MKNLLNWWNNRNYDDLQAKCKCCRYVYHKIDLEFHNVINRYLCETCYEYYDIMLESWIKEHGSISLGLIGDLKNYVYTKIRYMNKQKFEEFKDYISNYKTSKNEYNDLVQQQKEIIQELQEINNKNISLAKNNINENNLDNISIDDSDIIESDEDENENPHTAP